MMAATVSSSNDGSHQNHQKSSKIRSYSGIDDTPEEMVALTSILETNDKFIVENEKIKVVTKINSQISLSVNETVSISWHDIDVYSNQNTSKCIRVFKKDRQSPIHIIKNVSGHVKSGQILAIMGASGAGKTTLLNVLTGRNLSNVSVRGVVKLNGNRSDISSITSLSAYVQQDDLFISTLTVHEHLVFQSLVRMDQNISDTVRLSRINQVIKELGLTKCAQTRIGSSINANGISGGERKRLALASEVLTNPSIIFCDEPTSGLDSFMAENVVSVLKQMAFHGRTVICTIHQPSSEVFELFDQLLLLADGRVAYIGDLPKALDYFSSQGLNCPTNYNPADFYIRHLSIIPEREDECRTKIKTICDNYLNSVYAYEEKTASNDIKSNSYMNLKSSTKLKSKYKASFFTQLSALLWRSFLTVVREPKITSSRLAQTIMMAAILGLIYWRQELNQNGVMNINGALFLMLTNFGFQYSFIVMHTFCVELPLFLREHNNGMYRVDAYFIAKTFAELPIFLLMPLLFVAIYYYMVGFYSDFDSFIKCALITTLVANCAISYGYLISCAINSITIAISLGPIIMVPLLLFGGFFLNNDSIPVCLVWLKYVSWFYYGNEALMINQWRDIEYIECESVDNTTIANNFTTNCIQTGPMVLKVLNFDQNNLNRNIILLLVLLVMFRVFAYMALLMRSKKR